MNETLYTVEQVAERLGLHVKTVRNHVREGRLKAVRIGKQYRIAAADLALFTGQTASALDRPPVTRTRQIEVSGVIEISAVSPELSSRVTNLLMGAAHGKGQDEPMRVKTLYDPDRGQLKILIFGSLDTTRSVMDLIRAVMEPAQ